MIKQKIFPLVMVLMFGAASFGITYSSSSGGNEQAECPYLKKVEEMKSACPYNGSSKEKSGSECPFFQKDGKTKQPVSGKSIKVKST